MRAMPTSIAAALALTFAACLAWTPAALGFPFDSQQTGQPCSTCHVSPTGGAQLTATGQAYQASGRVWPLPQVQPTAVPAPAQPTAAPVPATPLPAPTAAPTAVPTRTAQPVAPVSQLPAARPTPDPGVLPSSGEDDMLAPLSVPLALFGLGLLGISVRFIRGRTNQG